MSTIRKHLRRLAFRRRHKTGTVTVSIAPDLRRFQRVMEDFAESFQPAMKRAAENLQEAARIVAYRARIQRERMLARAYLNNLVDAAYADLGLDRERETA